MAIELSVVLCVRNGLPLLRRQLAALAAQTWDGTWELLLVDNGCSDDSIREARERVGLPLSVVDARTARGLGAARNVGVRSAKGGKLLFCDADDEVAPDWLTEAASALMTCPFIGGQLRTSEINPPAAVLERPSPTATGLPTALGHLPYAVGANFGLERELFLSVGGCDSRFAICSDDIDLSWRLTYAGSPPTWAPNVIVDYRLRTSVRGRWKQQVNYGMGEELLRRAHADAGVAQMSVGETFRALALASRGVKQVFSQDRVRAARYTLSLAHAIGRTRGSWKHRSARW